MLKNKKVLVIGGAGYIGSHTVVELVSAGYEPVILDNFVTSKKQVIKNVEKLCNQKLVVYEADYTAKGVVKKILKDENIDSIIHFAAYKFVNESVENPLKYYSNNVSGFISLLETCKELNISNFVFSSSSAVYGVLKDILVNEQTVCNPMSPYGWTKYMDEIILRDFAQTINIKATALRYFNVIGGHESGLIGELPKVKPQNIMPLITRAAAGITPPLTVFGVDYDTPDGSCLRDYVDVVDLARAHVSAMLNDRKSKDNFEVYNVGTRKPTSVLELIKLFEETNHIKVPFKIGVKRAGDPPAYYADCKKINDELGWKATKSTADSVRSAWKWQQNILSNLS